MFQTALRRVPLAVATLTVSIVLGSGTLAAAPAGASATFTPELAAAQPAQMTVAGATAAQAAPASLQTMAQKRVAKPVVKKTKTAKSGKSTKSSKSAKSSGSELSRARALLAAQIRRHPILKGTTVTFGNAHGYQAICYYSSGRIVISPRHRASLSRIINHEVWHVIDWRDNRHIDWGERVPR